jgi:hypothetical protein
MNMQIKEVKIRPYKGIDLVMEDESIRALNFGKSKQEVRKIFDEQPFRPHKITPRYEHRDSFTESGIQVFYDENFKLYSISITSGDIDFFGKDFYPTPHSELQTWFCSQIDQEAIILVDGFTSRKYGVNVWIQDLEEYDSPRNLLIFSVDYATCHPELFN